MILLIGLFLLFLYLFFFILSLFNFVAEESYSAHIFANVFAEAHHHGWKSVQLWNYGNYFSFTSIRWLFGFSFFSPHSIDIVKNVLTVLYLSTALHHCKHQQRKANAMELWKCPGQKSNDNLRMESQEIALVDEEKPNYIAEKKNCMHARTHARTTMYR